MKLAATLLFVASGAIVVASISITNNHAAAKDFGRAAAYALLAGFCAYFTLRGWHLKPAWVRVSAWVRLISALVVFGMVVYLFGFTRISEYRKQKDLELLKKIAAKHSVELTKIGERLASALEQYRVEDAYPILNGRMKVTRAELSEIDLSASKALAAVDECASRSADVFNEMENEARSTGSSAASHFNAGVDSSISKLLDMLVVRRNFYEALHEMVQFLILKYGTFRANGETLIFEALRRNW